MDKFFVQMYDLSAHAELVAMGESHEVAQYTRVWQSSHRGEIARVQTARTNVRVFIQL